MRFIIMTNVLIIILSLAFLGGQVARIQLGNIGIVLLDFVVAGIVSSWVVYQLISQKKLPTLNAIQKVFLGVILVGVLGLIFYSSKLESQQLLTAMFYPLRLLAYATLFLVVKNVSDSRRQYILKAQLLVGGGIVFLGFIQYLFYPYLRNLYYLGWDDHLYRMFSVFLDPNFASAFFALFLLFLSDVILSVKERKMQIPLIILAAFTLLALYLTYSRTGFIMLLVGVGVYLLTHTSKKITLGILSCLVILFMILANSSIEGLNPFRVASSKARLESAENAIKIIQKYPVLGVGFNAYRYAQVEQGFREKSPSIPSHADASTDNSYLFVLATTGIVGFSIFVVFWFFVLRESYRMLRQNRYMSRSLFAGLLSMLVGSLFLNILFYPMIIGWILVHAGLTRQK